MAKLKNHLELVGVWPPQPVEIFSGYGFEPPRTAEIVLVRVVEEEGAAVTFHCRHARGGCRYQIETEGEEFAARLRALLARNVGRTLSELGDLEIGEE
jgi:hypothetical protein